MYSQVSNLKQNNNSLKCVLTTEITRDKVDIFICLSSNHFFSDIFTKTLNKVSESNDRNIISKWEIVYIFFYNWNEWIRILMILFQNLFVILLIKYFIILKVPRVSLYTCIMYIKLYKTPKMLNVHFASGQSPVGTSQFESWQ